MLVGNGWGATGKVDEADKPTIPEAYAATRELGLIISRSADSQNYTNLRGVTQDPNLVIDFSASVRDETSLDSFGSTMITCVGICLSFLPEGLWLGWHTRTEGVTV